MDSNKTHCLPCEAIGKPLPEEEINKYMQKLKLDWQLSSDHKSISKDFKLKNYYQTMAFVNAIAWMSHYENHHPDLEVGYNHCLVRYSTHALKGLSENDFICASKVDSLFQPYAERIYERKPTG